MKRILILVSEKNLHKEKLFESLKEYLGSDIEVRLGLLSEVTFYIEKNKVEAELDGESIVNFDLVYFRSSKHYRSVEKALAVLLSYQKVKFFDTYLESGSFSGDKLATTVRFALNDLPVIPTFYCDKSKVNKYIKVLSEKFDFPFVVKSLMIQRGDGIFLAKNVNELETILKSHGGQFLFQKFCIKDIEYRLLVLGDNVAVSEKKIQRDPNEFRSNVAKGAHEEFIDPKLIPMEMKDVAVRASKILKLEVGGADILVDKDGNIWLLEVNRGPGFTYDESSPELQEFAKFLKKELNISYD